MDVNDAGLLSQSRQSEVGPKKYAATWSDAATVSIPATYVAGEVPLVAPTLTLQPGRGSKHRRGRKRVGGNLVRLYCIRGLGFAWNVDRRLALGVCAFIDHLYREHLWARKPQSEFQVQHYDVLRKVIPYYDRGVSEYCLQHGLVQRDHFEVGKKSFGYRINPLLLEKFPVVLVYFGEPKIVSHYRNLQQRWKQKRLTAVERSLLKCIKAIRIDFDSFHRDFEGHERYWEFLHVLEMIEEGYRLLIPDDFSRRLHSVVTNLYRELRAYIRAPGITDRLWEIDISNSQPLLLAAAARMAGYEDPAFISACENGTLYDRLANHLGVERDAAKDIILKLIFKSIHSRKIVVENVDGPKIVEEWFANQFPFVHEYMRGIKARRGYKPNRELAREMQRAERCIVIDDLCSQIFEQKPSAFVLTIHDSILAPGEDIHWIRELLIERFEKVGICPNVKIRVAGSN